MYNSPLQNTIYLEPSHVPHFQEDCVKLCFSEDAVTILLDVLLFKPIQHISYVLDTIRVSTVTLRGGRQCCSYYKLHHCAAAGGLILLLATHWSALVVEKFQFEIDFVI